MKQIVKYTAIGLLIGAQMWGCSDSGEAPGFANQAPTVWLSSAPPEGSVGTYTVHLFWGGWDPDGEIAFYEYIVTDNESGVFDPADTTSAPGDYKWNRVNANDSTFAFSADLIPDSARVDFTGDHRPEEFRRSHTFFIRAVDREGLRSTKPAYRSFTSRTLSPTVFVDIPIASGFNPAQVPPITTFQWTGIDYVADITQIQEPDSVRHILLPISEFNDSWSEALAYIRNNPDAEEWSEWKWYQAPDDSGKFWTSPHKPRGFYYFAVQVMDEAGAVSPVFDLDRNLRRLLIGPRSTGPILTVTNQFMGTLRTSAPTTPPAIIDLPAAVPMQFEFSADASSYGGIVSGYRYGWDILDLNDPDQWEQDWTPFVGEDSEKSETRTFFFGTHSFFIEVTDNSGFKSRIEVRVNIVPFTMENDLLLVDDWLEGFKCFIATRGGTPCDIENDAFWNDMLGSLSGFNPEVDVFELGLAGRSELPIQILAKYKSLVWNATGNTAGDAGAFLNQMITFIDPDVPSSGGKTSPNLVGLYMAAGGHVLLAGNQIMTMVVNPSVFTGQGINLFPMIFRYELKGDQDGTYSDQDVGRRGVGENSFAYNECCLNVLDQTYLQNLNQQRRAGVNDQRCPTDQIRDRDRIKDGMRAALPLDLTTGGGFPQLNLRPEVSDPGKFYEFVGLVVDLYNPEYFATETDCGEPDGGVAEIIPPRDCFEPIYGNGCSNENSLVYNAPVAYWTGTFKDRKADVPGAVAARSAVWGFHPVYFEPDSVRQAIQIILHDEWKLPRK